MVRPAAPRLALVLGLAAALLALPGRAEGAESAAQPAKAEGQAPEVKKGEGQEAAQGEAKGAAGGGTKPDSSPITLDFYGIFGPSIRVGGAPAFSISRRAGVLGGGGVVFAPVKTFALGLSFEHVDLGSDRLGSGEIGSATADRVMNGLWLDLRLHPLRRETFSVFAGLGVGLAWQLARASRLEDPEGQGNTAVLSLCEASGSASVGLRGGAGIEVPLGRGIFALVDGWVENARLSGEVLDSCIGGAGATTLLTARVGLAYRLDLSSVFVSR